MLDSSNNLPALARLRRRDVLAWGAGLALLPSASRATWGRAGKLAIGYCRRSPIDADGPVTAVPADRLAAGEAGLARRGARVTLHGLVGDAERLRRHGIRALDLRIGFPVGGVEPGVDYLAWSHQLLPVAQTSSPVRFTVPVDSGLALSLELETLGSERFEARLVTGSEPGEPKLRSGHYLIAPAGTELPWRSFDPAGAGPFLAFSVEPIDA